MHVERILRTPKFGMFGRQIGLTSDNFQPKTQFTIPFPPKFVKGSNNKNAWGMLRLSDHTHPPPPLNDDFFYQKNVQTPLIEKQELLGCVGATPIKSQLAASTF